MSWDSSRDGQSVNYWIGVGVAALRGLEAFLQHRPSEPERESAMQADMNNPTGMNGVTGWDNQGGAFPGIAAAFLTGVVAGAAVALLFTPKAGREMRSDVRGLAGDVADKATRATQTVRDFAGDIIDRGSEVVRAAQKAYRDVGGRTAAGEGTESYQTT